MAQNLQDTINLVIDQLSTKIKIPCNAENSVNLALLDSPLGQLLAAANKTHLLSLECFDVDESEIIPKLKRLIVQQKCSLNINRNHIINALEDELTKYFQGNLKEFTIPLQMIGTEFQIKVWKQIQTVPYKQLRTYSDIAIGIDNPKSVRSVGSAVGANHFIILVPCHRIVEASGKLGGFSCGIHRKRILLKLERKSNEKLLNEN